MKRFGLVLAIVLATSAGTACVSITSAQAAKHPRKCRTKCRIKKARHAISGHSYSYDSRDGRGLGAAIQAEFCSDGTFRFQEQFGVPGYYYVHESYDGTWRVMSASRSAAQVAVTTADFQYSFDYSVVTSPPPSAPPQTATVQFPVGPGVIIFFDDEHPLSREWPNSGPSIC